MSANRTRVCMCGSMVKPILTNQPESEIIGSLPWSRCKQRPPFSGPRPAASGESRHLVPLARCQPAKAKSAPYSAVWGNVKPNRHRSRWSWASGASGNTLNDGVTTAPAREICSGVVHSLRSRARAVHNQPCHHLFLSKKEADERQIQLRRTPLGTRRRKPPRWRTRSATRRPRRATGPPTVRHPLSTSSGSP